MSTPTTSVIHDIGYKPYTGPRLGRGQILRALYVHGLRAVFGFGRGPKAKIVPWFVTLVMVIPAALNVYASSENKPLILDYSLMGVRMMLFTVLLVAVSAPELVTRDLRHHTLPLYFSRPLRRGDYPLAKLLALFTGVLAVTLLPVLITYLGQVASSTSGHMIWLDTRAAFPGLFVSVLQSAVLSVLALLLAASTSRRVIATGLIAIFFLVTLAISQVMANALGTSWKTHQESCVVPALDPNAPNLSGNLFGVGGGVNGPPDFVINQYCQGVNAREYGIDNVTGVKDPNKPGYADITVTYETPVYSAIAKAGGLANPVYVVEGLRIWVFNATDSDLPNPSPLGPLYGAEAALIVLGGSAGLFLRYRKVSVS
ncbi:ABC transporter permease subunit [Actinospica durhamensis]|uniref:ABC transporter permease subunit n=1 Tax=Actinospica durhamensis TaxID=1508375 RepID=A0A941ENQ5_9ACTN|nr:ABC transporter permease subunit [Actinospica durhamensis]MBR7832389.1 ABC transporter permease subunit [Actinospica durhamensis]